MQDTEILCSVCVANYNGVPYLRNCIDSILNQKNFPGNIEIIVHDDASNDESVRLLQDEYPNVRLLESTQNVGFCISNNRMVEEAKGLFILLLNNDAVLHDDALKTLYEASLKYGDSILGLPQYDVETKELIDIGSLFDLFLNPIPNQNRNLQDVGMVIGACLWLQKALWEKLGGFPEWFDSLAEDMYICCYARLQGYPVKVLSFSGFDHWVGRSLGGGKVKRNNCLSTTYRRRKLSERNKTFVMLICYPSPTVWLVAILHFFVLCLEGVMLTLIKRDKKIWYEIYFHCIKEVWRGKKVLLERRSQVQKLKSLSQWAFFRPFSIFPHKLRMMLKHGLPRIEN